MARRTWFALIAGVLLWGVCALVAAPRVEARLQPSHHALSWESLRSPERYRRLKAIRRSERRFEFSRRKVIRFAKSSFWNRRPYQFAGPVFADGRIFVGVDKGKFYAIDTRGMNKRWVFSAEGGIHAPAAVGAGHVYFGDIKGYAYALDGATGVERWRVLVDDEVLTAPLVEEDRVYVVTQSGRLFALDRQTGTEVWHTDPLEKRWGFSVRRASTPVSAHGMLYFGTSDGLLVAVRRATGQLHWVRQLGDRRAQVFDVDCRPVLLNDRLFVASADGGLFQLDTADGRIVWSLDVGGANDLILTPERLYTAGRGILSAVDPASGRILWQQDLETPEVSSPAGGEAFVAVVSTKEKLSLVDQQNGDIMFEHYVRGGSFGDPLVIGNDVYVVANTGRLFGFRFRELSPRKARGR